MLPLEAAPSCFEGAGSGRVRGQESRAPGFGVDAKLCAREELAVLGAAVAEAHSLHLVVRDGARLCGRSARARAMR